MRSIPFTKMSGLGNDFILVDNRLGILEGMDVGLLGRRLCARGMSLGGDQLMIIEQATRGGDLCMRTIKVDGTEVAMCGNAARCVARFACARGIAGAEMTIETGGGPVHAWVDDDSVRIELQLTSPFVFDQRLSTAEGIQIVHMVDVSGAPHAVVYLDGVAGAASETIHRLGSTIRNHADFPNGINVNFVQVIDRHTVHQRTFERGVEGETLACGTGAVASAAISAKRAQVQSPVKVLVLGGELQVTFDMEGEAFTDVFLSGGTRFVAEGTLHPEAWMCNKGGLRDQIS